MNELTCDNFHYRSLNIDDANTSDLQLTSFASSMPAEVSELLSHSVASNTRRAYIADLRHFLRWGGTIPATAFDIAVYLAEFSELRATSTLRRWTASISRAHILAGLPDPTTHEPARSTLRGIFRRYGVAAAGAAPLLKEDLFATLQGVGSSVRDHRDRALLLIGFAGGFRRSELVGLNIADVGFVRQGLIIVLRRSKTDQTGVGREIGIPFGKTRHCPVFALETWLRTASIEKGAVFRPVNRHGSVAHHRLSGEAVSIIVKKRVAAAGIDPAAYSGHSLRAGFCTSAAQAGVASDLRP